MGPTIKVKILHTGKDLYAKALVRTEAWGTVGVDGNGSLGEAQLLRANQRDRKGCTTGNMAVKRKKRVRGKN